MKTRHRRLLHLTHTHTHTHTHTSMAAIPSPSDEVAVPSEVAVVCTPSPCQSPGSSRSTATETELACYISSPLALRRSPRHVSRPSPEVRSLLRCLYNPNPDPDGLDSSGEEELGDSSDDDDDESWHLSTSNSVTSFSSSSSGGVIVTANDLIDELKNKYHTYQDFDLPADTIPNHREVVWHWHKGFKFDEQSQLVTGDYCDGIFRGQVNNKGLPHGIGYLVYYQDVYFFGCWVNGKEQGVGMLGYATGSFNVGYFENGVMTASFPMMEVKSNRLIRRIHSWPMKEFDFRLS